jgi:hypothetical protein
MCALYLSTVVILGQGGEPFSVPKASEARAFKGISGTLNQKNGVSWPQGNDSEIF